MEYLQVPHIIALILRNHCCFDECYRSLTTLSIRLTFIFICCQISQRDFNSQGIRWTHVMPKRDRARLTSARTDIKNYIDLYYYAREIFV